MCTVTYIPIKENSYILTSNRDETPKRQPDGIFQNSDKGLIYPKEPSKGGTWISASKDNQLLCLLNGAFVKHKHQPPYKRSRGLLVLDFFDYNSAEDFFQNYEMEGIEPFTLVVYEKGKLYEFRWDEEKKHLKELDSQQAYIWSSSTLYTPPIKKMREDWFTAWKDTERQPTAETILNFHQTAGIGDPENDLRMTRHGGIVQTVSITQFNSEKEEMIYIDLVNQEQSKSKLR